MEFSDTSGNDGIIQQIEVTTGLGLTAISGTASMLAFFTNLVNQWLHITTHWIQEAQGEWQYDDANHGNFPIETFAAVDNQQDYGLTSTGEKDSLIVRRVEGQWVSSDDWYDITFCHDKDIIEDWDGQTKGTPTQYWLNGGSIIFDVPIKAADVDYFRITYDRNAHVFVVGDTTAEPGFDKKFHMILVYGPAMEWGYMKNNASIVNHCQKMLFGSDPRRDVGLKKMLERFYGGRAKEAVQTYRRAISWK